MKQTYKHHYAIGFSVGGSTDPSGKDVSPAKLRSALLKRIEELQLSNDRWLEAVGGPDESCEEEHDFIVIAVDRNGRITSNLASAAKPYHAFTKVAQARPDLEMVVAVPRAFASEDIMTFAGESLVDGETILSQPEVYNF